MRLKAAPQQEVLGAAVMPLTTIYSYAIQPNPTPVTASIGVSVVGVSVGVSNDCAMRSNASGTVWASAAHHGIGVIPVNGHYGQECHGSECC
jgi:hypothetical protein